MGTKELWQSVLGELEIDTEGAHYKTWFRFTSILRAQDGHVIVAVPNLATKDWLEKHHKSSIARVLRQSGNEFQDVDFEVSKDAAIAQQEAKLDPGKAAKSRKRQEAPTAPLPIGDATVRQTSGKVTPGRPSLNPDYTFDNFVVGNSNELAYAACKAVVTNPGVKYNPLLIYGGVGLGKTHLAQAIGNELLARNPSIKVEYVTSERFTNEFIDSIKSKRNDAFTHKYRQVDVLIIDDIQFFAGKEGTQEELFHTFNDLHQAHKHIILTSDRPPKAIPKLEARLRSRFDWGMSADIQRPDLETRSAIIQSKAQAQGLTVEPAVTEYIARHFQHNIRELEGALTKLMAKCETYHILPTIEVAQEVIDADGMGRPKRKPVSTKRILESCSHYYGLSASDLTGPKRDKELVRARQVAMYVMREELGLSYPKIGSAVGGRDHSTAMHSITKVERLLESDDELRSDVSSLRDQLTSA